MGFFNFIIWSAEPEIFPNISWLPIRWYGLLFLAGFVIGQQSGYFIFKKEGKPVKDVDTLIFILLICTVVGARLGHVIFYDAKEYLANPIEILKVWGGGLASHGAGIGILIGLYIYSRKKANTGQTFLWIADRVVIFIAIAGVCIRMGNFINSEIIGTPTNSDYGVVFAKEVVDVIKYNENTVEEVSFNKANENDTIAQGKSNPMTISVEFKRHIQVDSIAMQKVNKIKRILGISKIAQQHVVVPPYESSVKISKTKQNTIQADFLIQGIARYPAQLYEAFSCLILAIVLLLIWLKKKENVPQGMLLGIFLVVIFGLRFFYEYYKENQSSFEENMTLNMGQILSIPMIIMGVYILLNLKKI